MVGLRQVKIPFYRGYGRQLGRDFSAFAQAFGRTAVLLPHKHIIPPAKRLCADLSGFAVREFGDVVSSGQSFKTATKKVGRQTLKKNCLVVADKRVPANSFLQILQNKPVGRKELFLQTFLNIQVKLFSVPVFCGSF